MAFIKADLNKELEELNELVNDNEEARKAYEAFQKRIALQEQLSEASHDLSRVLPTACLAAGPPFGVRTAFPPYSLGSAVTLPQQ